MMRRILLLALLLLPMPAAAEIRSDPGIVADIRYGIWCVTRSGETSPAPGTLAGYTYQASVVEHRQTALLIPIVPGLSFGFELTFEEDATGTLPLALTHPPFLESGTTRQTLQDVPISGEIWRAYTFDTPEEEVAGEWTYTLGDPGSPLFEITFTTIPVEGALTQEDWCAPGPVFSRLAPGGLSPAPPAGRG